MSKQRIILISALGALLVMAMVFLLMSLFRSDSGDMGVPIIRTAPSTGSNADPFDSLAPLPNDHGAAIENEVEGIRSELDSVMEVEIDDLEDVEMGM